MSFLVKTSKTTLVLFILCISVVLFPACQDKSTSTPPVEPQKNYFTCTMSGAVNVDYVADDISLESGFSILYTSMSLNGEKIRLKIWLNEPLVEGKSYEFENKNDIYFSNNTINFNSEKISGYYKVDKCKGDIFSGTFSLTLENYQGTYKIDLTNGKFYYNKKN